MESDRAHILIEACVESVAEAVACEAAGAGRLEVCRDLSCGGLTPDPDIVRSVRHAVNVPVHVLVRPRPGGFEYTDAEIRGMRGAIREALTAGADGLVVGVLARDGRIPAGTLALLTDACDGRAVTFHRAFDVVRDPAEALVACRQAGVSRVLTAGGQGTAWRNRYRLARLAALADSSPRIMPGGAVRAGHVRALVQTTGACEVHARASAVPALVAALKR